MKTAIKKAHALLVTSDPITTDYLSAVKMLLFYKLITNNQIFNNFYY